MLCCKVFNLKRTFFVLTVLIFAVITVVLLKMEDLTVKLKRRNMEKETKVDIQSSPPETLRTESFLKVFHLDLKGGPPRMSFLLSLLPLVRRSGANAILVEYEDMFPFLGRLKNVSAGNAYTLRDLKRLVDFAEGLKMEVIPLVQTFGHLEYVLKLEEFQHLRENDNFPQEICPMKVEAVDLVKEMIRQVMAVHTNSKYIHIGCDEIRHLGVCFKCSRIKHSELFSKHIIKLSNFIKSKYPGVTPLIWDDMLRKRPYFINVDLGSAVELVVWVYGSNIFDLVPPFIWRIYHHFFPRIWVASAFKGAFGEMEILPNLTLHLNNHLSWMKIFFPEENNLAVRPENFTGIVLTGWSRYDHFAALCELLPVGIPSLVLGLVFLERRFMDHPSKGFAQWLNILKCPSDILPSGELNETYFQDKLGNCSFPGSDLYSGAVKLLGLRARGAKMERQMRESGWTTSYHLRRNFTSPWRLLEMFPKDDVGGKALMTDVYLWKVSFERAMEEYFDKYTRSEWLEQHVRPLEESLKEIHKISERIFARKTWPKRPLP